MFDKNSFKDAFRSWAQNNPDATEDEALVFCQNTIPAAVYNSQFWLVDQSVQWFHWLKSQRTFDDGDLHEDDDEMHNRILC